MTTQEYVDALTGGDLKTSKTKTEEKQSMDSTNTEQAIIQEGATSNTSHILQDTQNILNQIQILIGTIAVVLTIIAVVVGIGGYKYIVAFNKMRDKVKLIDLEVLRGTHVLLSAVPFIETTQITSSSYYKAINTISSVVKNSRKEILDNPEYVDLLIVEALDDWLKKSCSDNQEYLEKAYNVAKDDKLRKDIAFHLARIYKQIGAQKINIKKEVFYNRSLYYARKTHPVMKQVIELSMLVLRVDEAFDRSSITEINISGSKSMFLNILNKPLKRIVYKTMRFFIAFLNKEKIVNFEEILLEIFNKDNLQQVSCFEDLKTRIIKGELFPSNLAKWTAMTVIALDKNKLLVNNEENQKLKISCAKLSLKMFNNMINSQTGTNIKASWYYTMLLLSEILFATDNGEYFDQLKNNMWLAEVYLEKALSEEIKILFCPNKLIKISIKEFQTQLNKDISRIREDHLT